MNDEWKEILEGAAVTNFNACCYLEDESEAVETVYYIVLSSLRGEKVKKLFEYHVIFC
jgi:hypothetical protein